MPAISSGPLRSCDRRYRSRGLKNTVSDSRRLLSSIEWARSYRFLARHMVSARDQANHLDPFYSTGTYGIQSGQASFSSRNLT
jgi:hypothetical protein